MRAQFLAAASFLTVACSDAELRSRDEVGASEARDPFPPEHRAERAGEERRSFRLDDTPFGRILERRSEQEPDEADAGTSLDAGTPEIDAGGASTDAGSAGASASVLGFNLDFLSGGGFTFANEIKTARRWISCTSDTWDDGRAIALDAGGWPTSLLDGQQATTVFKVHGGNYVVTWTGSGALEVREHSGVVSQQPNRVVVSTAPDSQLQLRILSVPVRDIEVRREGESTQLVWDPLFEQRLAGASVIRYMQWGMTNGDNGGVPQSWAERSQPSYFTQNQRYGVAYEHMIALSNHLRAGAWITIPHLADDTYVENLAVLLRDTLDPSSKVYVEWSNEVWNDSFPQALYARQRGAAAGLGGGDGHVARLQYQARRTREVFQIFESVFAGQMNRVVRVVASQCGNAWNDDQLMSFEGLSTHADALAVAPYFGHSIGRSNNAQNVRNGGATWVLDQLENVALPGLVTEIQMSAASAAQWGVPLIAYEGGQHVVAEPAIHDDVTVTSVLEAAQRDPRMYNLYAQLMAAWDAAGAELFVHYTYTGIWGKWGYWGSLENNDSPLHGDGAHKYRALLDWAATHP